MKKLLPLLLSLLLLTACADPYDDPTTSESVLTRVDTTYDSLGESTHSRTDYTYDIHGNQAQILDYSGDEPYLKTVLNHDASGNVTRQRQYDLSGWFPKKLVDIRYTYDDQGRMTSSRHRSGFHWDDTTITYDDNARTRTTSVSGHTTIEYLDEHGWVIRSEATSADGQVVVEEYDRRPDGLIEATRSYRDGVLFSTTQRTYDDQGRPLTWTATEDGETTLLYRWEYGENYETQFFSDGSHTTTDFNEDGTPHARQKVSADDIVVELTLYRYTEIQVPAKEESP